MLGQIYLMSSKLWNLVTMKKIKMNSDRTFKAWNYAIRGRTIDGDDLRIAVYFEEDVVMIATVIRLLT